MDSVGDVPADLLDLALVDLAQHLGELDLVAAGGIEAEGGEKRGDDHHQDQPYRPTGQALFHLGELPGRPAGLVGRGSGL